MSLVKYRESMVWWHVTNVSLATVGKMNDSMREKWAKSIVNGGLSLLKDLMSMVREQESIVWYHYTSSKVSNVKLGTLGE